MSAVIVSATLCTALLLEAFVPSLVLNYLEEGCFRDVNALRVASTVNAFL
jgi:hypothetical protein